MTITHIHLVSDATGETINSVARACLAQFHGIEPVEHAWSLVHTKRRMEKALRGIRKHPGPVLFTLVNKKLRDLLLEGCKEIRTPCIPVLDPVIHRLAACLNVEISGQPGLQHVLNAEYFERMDAMNFALAHDDGQLSHQLNTADVIILGVSRTSKTPTCIYLANRGIKAANVPIVPGCPLPEELKDVSKARGQALIVGLTKDPARLVQIRRNRMRMIASGQDNTDYVDLDSVREEITFARRLYRTHRWPEIDVTRRSIEETAATIMMHIMRHQGEAP